MTGVDRIKALLTVLVTVALVSVVLVMHADLALHKPFWLDEGHEIVRTCDQPAGTLLLRGAYECSPAPLYWILQGFVVRSVEPLGLALRLEYRAVSLTAAAVTLLLLLLGPGRRLGVPSALVAFSVLLTDPAFHFYAAQNRAYMTWAAITTILVVAASEASVLDDARFRWGGGALLAAGALAGLTALPGCLQAAGAFAACVAMRSWFTPGGRLDRRNALLLGLGALAILAVDVHYWLGSPCRGWQGARDYGLDLLESGTRAPMIRHALAVIWPEGWSPWVLLGHVLLLAGAALPFAAWRRRTTLVASERYAVALSLVALTQVLVAVPVAAGLAAGRYLFLPRMFIFVMVARAALVAAGFWWMATLAQRAAARAPRLAAAVPMLAAGALAAWASWQGVRIMHGLAVPLAPVGTVSCEALRTPLLHVLEPARRSPEFTPNFLVRLGRALDSCAATPIRPGPPAYLLALEAEAGQEWSRVATQPADGFKPLQVCGRPVALRDGHVRFD